MSDEADRPAGDRGEPNGQFTVFHLMVVIFVVLMIFLPARDGYRAGGVRGLIGGLATGVFVLAPMALVLGMVGLAVVTGLALVFIRPAGGKIRASSDSEGRDEAPPADSST